MANVTQLPEWSREALERFKVLVQKEPIGFDGIHALFDNLTDLNPVKEIAKESGRITEVSLHKPGDVVTLDDGRKYQVDDDGKWNRLS